MGRTLKLIQHYGIIDFGYKVYENITSCTRKYEKVYEKDVYKRQVYDYVVSQKDETLLENYESLGHEILETTENYAVIKMNR